MNMKDVKNNLINQSLLEKKLKEYKEEIQDNSQIFLKWHNETRNERKIQANFLNDIFGNILGYEFETDKEEYNLDYEQTTDKSRKPVDGVLGFFKKENRKIKVIIELKGKDTKNINTIEQQAFDYLKEFSDVDYIITSNTETIRLYSKKHMSVKYIEWTMSKLANSFAKQKEFHFFLAKGRLFTKDGLSEVAKLIEENIKEEKEIKDKFYKEYKEKRVKLINVIKLLNPSIDAISKAQKLLDRMLFIRFCIDRGYITQNIVKTIENLIKLRFTFYQALKVLFETIDKGSGDEIKDDFEKIIAWNGGLFAEDIELNDLQIGSEILKEIDKFFKSYNFSSQVDVHILGHIFEQSISDIEKLKNGEEFDAKQSKRKKDGVFYTPEYITKYIVEEAVGGWLKDRKTEIKSPENTKEYWKEYIEILKSIKVLDPACGSGAFLVEVFNYLQNEWNIVINNISDLKGDLFDFNWNYKDTLKNNIYGVDINFESVQITRLSLWIQTAHNKTALVSLDENIKCGNSLIDDPAIAGDKAFNWEEEFPFKFDVVVGNPPYGAGLSELEQNYMKQKYDCGSTDTAAIFVYKANFLTKEKANISFIIPKSYCYASNYEKLRQINKNQIYKLVDCGKVWNEVLLEQIIICLSKNHTKQYISLKRDNEQFQEIGMINQQDCDLFGFFLNGISEKELNLAKKIKANCVSLNDVAKNIPGDPIQKHTSEIGEWNVVGGAEIDRFGIRSFKGKMKQEFVDGTNNSFIQENSLLVQRIVAHIELPNDHIQITVCIPQIKANCIIVNTINQIVCNDNCSNYYIWLLLNNKLVNWYAYRFIFGKAIRTMQFYNPTTSRIPIPQTTPANQAPFIEKAQAMLALTKQLNEIVNSFYDYLLAKLDNPTNDLSKLKNWHKLDNSSFLELINKIAKVQKISIDDEVLLGKFKEKILITNDLQAKISQTDNEIDKMVYALYGLSEKEIEVVESVI